MTRVPAPHDVLSSLQDSVLSYVDTTFWLKDPSVAAERRALLSEPGTLFQEPLIEPVLPYPGEVPSEGVCADVGLDAEESRLLLGSVFGSWAEGGMQLRQHQAESLLTSLEQEGVPAAPCDHLRDWFRQDGELPASRAGSSAPRGPRLGRTPHLSTPGGGHNRRPGRRPGRAADPRRSAPSSCTR